MNRFLISLSILFLLSLSVFSESSSAATNRMAGPWVFTGYRSLTRQWLPDTVAYPSARIWREVAEMEKRRAREIADSLAREEALAEGLEALVERSAAAEESGELDWGSGLENAPVISEQVDFGIPSYEPPFDAENPIGPALPDWLHDAIQLRNIQDDFMYGLMVVQPRYIEYAEWDLPIPPTLPAEDKSFVGFLKTLHLPEVKVDEADVEPEAIGRINWLHTLNLGLQLSQAYISHNWYQGGNDYLAFFGNFLWDVVLNPVYHKKVLLQSTLSYKLAINSTSQDEYHKYTVSQELFQYNFKFGYKAAHHWYYSFTTQFKTQFLHNYAQNSMTRVAGFLSPGDLNLGIGMTYNYQKPNKKLSFSASLAPLSYNLRTCIDRKVDHAQFNMKPDQRTHSEYGSNAELNFYWALRDNISYKSRLFAFTDYKNFTNDWENTFNFQFSRFFSTQLYLYFRYDSDTNPRIAPKWKKWMLKEILSVGLSYTFATKTK